MILYEPGVSFRVDCIPAIKGVPTAPNAENKPSSNKTLATDIIGLNPNEINITGTIVPGVPKPATPSKNPVRLIIIKKNKISFEGCIWYKDNLISSTILDSSITWYRNKAPKTIISIFNVEINETINDAQKNDTELPQRKKRIAVIIKEIMDAYFMFFNNEITPRLNTGRNESIVYKSSFICMNII